MQPDTPSIQQSPQSLSGKRVLFVAPRFFSYEQDIATALAQRGAHVDYLRDRPFDTPFMTAVTRFQRRAIMPAVQRYYERQIAAFGQSGYDIIFVVNGQTMPRAFLSRLRRELPRAQFILHMWDSFENRSSALANLDLFDQCSSFDPKATETLGIRLRPLFFAPGFERAASAAEKYDISFVGTAHTDRYNIVSKVNQVVGPETRRYWYLFLQAKWVYYAYRVTNPGFSKATISDFKFMPLDRATVHEIFQASRCILDIEHPRQTGLTMRTLETLGARKKLVTTNAGVRDYPFYRPENIHVIDRENPEIPQRFFDEPYRPIPDALYRHYSLDGWLDDILGVKAPR
jgi:hypothetical protein